MKKLLVILSVLLALCICLTSCNLGNNNSTNDDAEANVGAGGSSGNGGSETEGGSSSDSKQAIIDAFAAAGDLDSLMENLENELGAKIDPNEVYNEILKIKGEGMADVSMTANGQESSFSNYIGYKDGTVAVDLDINMNGESAGSSAYGFFTEDLKFVLVTVDSDGAYYTQIEDFGMYLDLDEMLGDLEGELDGAVNGSAASMIQDFKLPELKKSEISVKDGKYIISKDYWKKVVTYTVDAMLDSLKNGGAEVDEEQLTEIKNMANDVLDNVKLDIFFRMDGSKFQGFGVDIEATAENLERALGPDMMEELDGEFVSASLSLDMKAKGDYLDYVDFDMEIVADAETNMGMDVSFRVESIFDGEGKIAGFNMVEDATITTVYYRVAVDEYGNEYASEPVAQVISVDAEATLDLTKLDVAGADVFEMDMSVVSEEDGENDGQLNVYASVKSCGNNEFDFNFGYVDADNAEESIYVSGSVEYNENPDNFPEIPSYVIDARDEALAHDGDIAVTPEYDYNY